MLSVMTSRYHDSGILALGFSAGAVIDGGIKLLAAPDFADHQLIMDRLVCGALVGPLIAISLLLTSTIPHRIVLVMGLAALLAFVVLGFR